MEGVFISICELICSLNLLFPLCELASRMSIGFEDINDLIDQFDWYLMPLETQQMLPLIMVNAQQPVGFQCFGSFACNRDLFKKVIFDSTKWKQISPHAACCFFSFR